MQWRARKIKAVIVAGVQPSSQMRRGARGRAAALRGAPRRVRALSGSDAGATDY
jgi:hypothetical protein